MISGRCAACKNQRRKCPSDCIFSPYFPSNDPQRYASVHRIYGGSNIGKMLQQIPPYVRAQAADSLYYEAQCRVQDPTYGCYGIISQLVQQIHSTETELAKIQAQISILKLQTPQVEYESNFDVLLARSSKGQFQFGGHSSQTPSFKLFMEMQACLGILNLCFI